MAIKLYTIQDENGWNGLQNEGVLLPSVAFIESDLLASYNWMKAQMQTRIGQPSSQSHFPVWAWYQYHSEKQKKPDLRRTGHLKKGAQGVRLTIEKEEKDVLLSDYILWHIPLNNDGYIGASESDTLRFEEKLKNEGLQNLSTNELPNDYRAAILKSWEKIFDLDFDCPYWTEPKASKAIQATFWELRLEEVVEVEHFIAK